MTDEHTWPWLDKVRSGLDSGLIECGEVNEFLVGNAELRAALGLGDDVHFDVVRVGNGEHNENFRFDDEASRRRYVLRVNRANISESDDDAVTYSARVLRAASGKTWAPRLYYAQSESALRRCGVMVVDYLDGHVPDISLEHDLRAVARAMAGLHCLDGESLKGSLVAEPDLVGDLLSQSIAWRARYAKSPFAQENVLRHLDAYIRAVQDAEYVSACEGDLGHVVMNEVGPGEFLICGDDAVFVDWDTPSFGQIERDIADFVVPTTSLWDTEYVFTQESALPFYEEYWEAVGGRMSADASRSRLDACVMACALRGVAWCADALVDYQEHKVPIENEITRTRIEFMLSDDMFELLDERVFAWC